MDISQELQIIVNAAYHEARNRKHEYFTPEHLLFTSLDFDIPRAYLESSGADPDLILEDLEEYFKKHMETVPASEPLQTEGLQNIIERTMLQMSSAGKDTIRVGDILIAILDEPQSFASYYMKKAGVSRLTLLDLVSHPPENLKEYDDPDGMDESDDLDESDMEDYGEAGESTSESEGGGHRQGRKKKSALDQYTTDLTRLAEEGKLEPLIGRDDILERTIQILSRRLKNNPVHVGEPGVGKTAITEGLAFKIVNDDVPSFLKGFRIYSLDMGSLLAGTRFRGDFEERMKRVLKDLENKPKSMLFIDEIHTIIGAGAVSGGTMDAGNLLKPALAKGQLRCIGSTTYEEYKKYFEKDHALARRFQKVDIPETTVDETLEILKGLQKVYEEHHGVLFTDESLEAAVRLSDQYINEKHLPDKAIDLIDEAGAWKALQKEKDGLGDDVFPKITDRDIEKVVASIARIPEKSVSANETDKLKTLDEDLKKNLFGQNEAVEAVTMAIRRSRAGFRQDNKPVASFLFVGPTGVGKTELARLLASELGVSLHRIDMSEYQEKHTVSRLIGSPPGYVGYEEGGLLTDTIRKNPHAVLLLDEIEKAHQDVYNILLQMMDYATVTDNMGRKADFRHAVIIMTSNAGARDIGKSQIGFGDRVLSAQAVNDEVNRIFTPEFRNRLDKIITFGNLPDEVVVNIVKKELSTFEKQLKAKGVSLEVSDECIHFLAKEGYSYEYGARNIARLIDEKIKTFFIDQVLFGSLSSGGKAKVELKDGDVHIEVSDS
ncbi:ATP-dependent Clp protease ATP-binding subunit ClpA [Oceanispirochaeta sp. M2]|uniref:ATP-dependent Clp protease ATP-binding subunit ClpA n=2 Tax=Oceanispirochaeta TaxID=2035349 RepID=UPI000E09BB68|nr:MULTISPECIES: ATP-dependent Clp protease ATP-binding subunit ClpA [unclassified Oceanispirochaeta]MBF9015944.1 ATP-dependent Clp protease ATP-binding subunit ClpA [Oceanispirochaeta sp. M2]NPD72407.1 ATP-dependent Clp protease ATP-binding subunit ClpA [Oceanispirochaeta sp. M1]RDG32177.1 ATP-dependent Clp protease ATP-binding subunit ClpA [Oceanispirochaeta sp. M1]